MSDLATHTCMDREPGEETVLFKFITAEQPKQSQIDLAVPTSRDAGGNCG